MPDYAHPLLFGTFITPVNSPPDAAVQRAVLSEQLGYDLVTFQDHPYQPSFHDTWTLMSWVAAKTERIHVSANVINVPMRPAAVLARSAASLDLLSGGRFDLAIGAGAFWDAMVGMGLERLTPGQAVSSLDEAITVIRSIWDVDDHTPLRIDGDYYQLSGAKRGPAPAHDIPIWIGALKPRMLRLVGRKGDGWLPSYAYLQPGDLERGHAAIDEAAIEAGRDPREIRRLLNITGRFSSASTGFLAGPSDQWVDELLPLVLENGTGTFILATDDPGTLQQFAEEVAPALREAVAIERGPVDSRPVRNSIVLGKRVDGIDYDSLPESLAATAVEPGDHAYTKVRSTYMRGGAPGLVLRPADVSGVVDALAVARLHPEIPLGVRSAGHGISGRSTNTGGIVIDLSALSRIEILDVDRRLVRIEPGAKWADVAVTLGAQGWALSSGDYGGVGVGGLATAGGIGWLSRKHGLTIDHLRAVDVVVADGSLVHASPDDNPELFWGMRGAGANFGIAVSFEFEVDPVGDVGWAQLAYDATDTAGFLERWGATIEAAPRDVTSNLLMGGTRPGQQAIAQVFAMVDSSDPDEIIEHLQPLAEIAPLVQQSVELKPYAAVMANNQGSGGQGQGEPASRSGLLDHITPEFAASVARLLASGAVHFFQIRAVGGAVSDVAPDATAYAHRSANFSVVALGAHLDRVSELWDDLLAPHFEGLYLSFDTDLRPERLADAFPEPTLGRLRALKREWDPQNLFRDNFNIAP